MNTQNIHSLANIDIEALTRHGFTEHILYSAWEKALEIPYWERVWTFIEDVLAKKRPHELSEAQRSWRDRIVDDLRD